MSEPWYEIVPADAPLTQGDLVLRCPLLTWAWPTSPPTVSDAGLRDLASAFEADVVVLTQACDLEFGKVRNVVLCPHLPLQDYRRFWDARLRELGQNPSEKAWRRMCDDVAAGYVWNHAFLNQWTEQGQHTDVRIVDFHEVYTLPRAFLERMLADRKESRLRLRPPYREHLSQAFARFFMRVGLPTPVDKAW
jgi:hypothetical protein